MCEEAVQWDRKQTVGEEVANSISHSIGFVGASAITPIMIIAATPIGTTAVVGASIFGSTMMLLYLASTLYHACPHGRTKRIFQIFDHGGIYLLIAGTYTPFTLVSLPSTWGLSMFFIVWGLALLGVIYKTVSGPGTSRLSTALYLAMGWMAVLAAGPLWENLSGSGLSWLIAGGVIYTAGVMFFIYDHKIRYSHFIWHLFVLAGTTCHVFAVLRYVYKSDFFSN